MQVTCYEALKEVTEYGRQKWFPNSRFHVNSSFEGLVLGGIAGGIIFIIIFFYYMVLRDLLT